MAPTGDACQGPDCNIHGCDTCDPMNDRGLWAAAQKGALDAKRLDWLEEFDSERLEDVRGHINNEGGTVREAIDFFMGQS